jgi:hypothetical protein
VHCPMLRSAAYPTLISKSISQECARLPA